MMQHPDTPTRSADGPWLMRYYFVRAIVSACWVTAAFAIGGTSFSTAVMLASVYPAWDCIANLGDARRNGGLSANPTQAFNALVSAIVTAGVIAMATPDFHAVVRVFGIWAILAGLMQLATAVRRWRGASAQWPMILSGAQSALAGGLFIKQAGDQAATLGVATIAPYAGVGAAYFAISAVILAIKAARRRTRSEAAG